MCKLKQLKSATTLQDLAKLLRYKPSDLSFITYMIPPKEKYHQFSIYKRNRSLRVIHAPCDKLKVLQKRLADLLYQALNDLDKDYEHERGFIRRKISHGFSKNLSIITNAAQHRNRRYVFNVDLADFFPSINFGRVRGVLSKDNRFMLHETVATIIAQIACYEGHLPQGSPCSPVISNIVSNFLDVRLVRFARKHKCTYTRYADDITFSTNLKLFPSQIAIPFTGNENEWFISSILESEITRAGFAVNHAKTRMQHRTSRQVVTGLLVNKKVNVVPEYYRLVRVMCDSYFKTGQYYLMHPEPQSNGELNRVKKEYGIKEPHVLEGMLSFLYHVKCGISDNQTKHEQIKEKNDAKSKSAIHSLYRKFLIFTKFITADMPIIITEGITDIPYLKITLKKFSSDYPQLCECVDEKFKLHVKFLNYKSKTAKNMLGLSGGTGPISYFISYYRSDIPEFVHKPLLAPIIVLIDNDEGAFRVFDESNKVREIDAITISHETTEPFYHLYDNLYLVKTPELERRPKKYSDIESFLPQEYLDRVINGKKFDPSGKGPKDTTYNKVFFIQHVIVPNKNNIDFSGFKPLLDRINAVVTDYATRQNNGQNDTEGTVTPLDSAQP